VLEVMIKSEQMPSKRYKILGFIEIILAGFFGIISIASCRTAYFPPAGTHWEAPGWAFLIFIVFTPLCLSTGLAGFAMLKDFRHKWRYHALMIGVVFGIILFFWYADHV